MNRHASAHWTGDLRTGHGTITTGSNVLHDTPYSFVTRFENSPGTNPEELIGAAHAGCFTMALSAALQKAGFKPDSIDTTATVSLDNIPPEGWTIAKVHLETTVKVSGPTPAQFAEIAAGAKAGCPVSRLLKAEITLDAKLA